MDGFKSLSTSVNVTLLIELYIPWFFILIFKWSPSSPSETVVDVGFTSIGAEPA